MKKMEVLYRNILSFDAETNGLYGQAFCIAGAIYDHEGRVLDKFIGRCPIEGQIDSWVEENVLPQLTGIKETADSYIKLLQDYMSWRKEMKDKYDPIELVHMGVPVESRLFIDAQNAGLIGPFDGPYPLVDCSAIPEIWDSPETYLRNAKISINSSMFDGGTHNPLYDAAVAHAAYRHWLEN